MPAWIQPLSALGILQQAVPKLLPPDPDWTRFFVFPHSKVLPFSSQSLTHLLVSAARVLPGGPHPHRQDEDVEEDDGGDARPVDHLLDGNGGERTMKRPVPQVVFVKVNHQHSTVF